MLNNVAHYGDKHVPLLFPLSFQRLKAALTQQHSQVTNGDTAKGQASSLVRTRSEEARPQSLQQPATSTTETPVGGLAFASVIVQKF